MDEREFELINIIGGDLGSNQRDLSKHMNLSLGMINMLIRRLLSKGYIRIEQLNKRKVQYILTPKGFAEKMRKSIKYTMKTISSIGLIKEKIQNILIELYEKGEKNYVVLGKSDFALLIEMTLREKNLQDCTVQYVDEMPQKSIQEVILVCKENYDKENINKERTIDLIHEISKDNLLHINYIGD